MNPDREKPSATLKMPSEDSVLVDAEQPPLPKRQLIAACLGSAVLVALPLFLMNLSTNACYDDGLSFKKGLHAFGFLIHAARNFVIFLGAWILALIALCSAPADVRRRFLGFLIVILLTGGITCLLTINLCESAFRRGRNEAYSATDFKKLVAACRDAHQSVGATRPAFKITEYCKAFDNLDLLPPGIREFSPAAVIVGHRGVVVHMDGGGIAAKEGYLVPLVSLNLPVEESARIRVLEVLNEAPPVFKFQADDVESYLEK